MPTPNVTRSTWAWAPTALAMALLGAPAWAQTVPGAGRLLEETRRNNTPALPAAPLPRLIEAPVRPTVTMPEGVKVTVTGFRISGAASFPLEELEALVKPWVGKSLDIAGLNEAAGALTRHYQSKGHMLSYAYLPAQRVADGVIELAVLEGRLEGVQIVSAQDARLRDEVVQAHTESLATPGPLLQSKVERQLLLLNDIPGVTARAAFTPGASTGASDMVVSVAEDEPLVVRGEINNHGTESTGKYRIGVDAELRDLFGWGDNTTMHILASNKGSLISGSLGASVPLGGDGFRLGASLSHLTYELAGSFKQLGAVGSADVLGMQASYPLRRTLDSNLGLKAGFEHRRLSDELQLLGTITQKRNDVADLSAGFDARDDFGGASGGSATLSFGKLEQAGVGTHWRKLGLQIARQQAVAGPFSLYGRLAGQYTGNNLDSSDKFGLGGPGGVRAYSSGQASVDVGSLFSLEARYGHDLLGGGVVASIFYDQGNGRVNRTPLPAVTDNTVKLSGAGLGLSWSGGGIGVNASVAWRGQHGALLDATDSQPRFYFQMLVTP